MVAGAVMGHAAAATADDQARRRPTDGAVAFSYSRAPDVLACTQADETAVRDLLEGVMHTAPFVRKGASAPFDLRAEVTKRKDGQVQAVLELRNSEGQFLGTSTLNDASCDGTHTKMAVGIALLLVPPPPKPPLAPVCDAACRAAVKNELRAEVREEIREPVLAEAHQEIRKECKDKYCPHVDFHAVISAGAIVGFNYAADPAPGFWLAGEARGKWWSAMLEARGVMPTRVYTLLNGLGTVDISSFSGLLSPCLRWKWLSGCALVEVGALINSIPGSYDDGASDPFVGLGLRGRVDIPITSGVEVRLFGDAMVHAYYVRAQVSDPTGPGGFENPALFDYEAPRLFSAFVGVGIAKAFE